METESFNLHKTLEVVKQAMQAVICHMLFDFALHGIIVSIFLALLSMYLIKRKYSHGAAIGRVAKRIVIFSLLLTIPGFLALMINHKLPDAGLFNFNSIGLLSFWSLISVHLIFEEINNSLVKTSVKSLKSDG